MAWLIGCLKRVCVCVCVCRADVSLLPRGKEEQSAQYIINPDTQLNESVIGSGWESLRFRQTFPGTVLTQQPFTQSLISIQSHTGFLAHKKKTKHFGMLRTVCEYSLCVEYGWRNAFDKMCSVQAEPWVWYPMMQCTSARLQQRKQDLYDFYSKLDQLFMITGHHSLN